MGEGLLLRFSFGVFSVQGELIFCYVSNWNAVVSKCFFVVVVLGVSLYDLCRQFWFLAFSFRGHLVLGIALLLFLS